jgi:hypothetical protein
MVALRSAAIPFKLTAVFAISLSATCSLSQLADAPHRVDRALEIAAITSIGFDAYATDRNWSQTGVRCYEVNPVARPLVSNGTASLAAYFAASAGGFLFAHHVLAEHHHRMTLALDVAVVAAETYWSEYSFAHHLNP